MSVTEHLGEAAMTCPYLDFLPTCQSGLCSFFQSAHQRRGKKLHFLAAMQPQNFLEAINGQAVDSYSEFFFFFFSFFFSPRPPAQWKGGLPDYLRVSDAELQ